MDPAVKSSLLWGLVGTLAFLVLAQAYHLVTESFISPPVLVGVAVAVGVVSGVTAHLLRPRARQV